MGLSKYNVNVNGTTATLRLSDADAKARGLTAKDLVGTKPATRAWTAMAAPAPKAAPAPLNKSATATDKSD